jgi:hypothetical protein
MKVIFPNTKPFEKTTVEKTLEIYLYSLIYDGLQHIREDSSDNYYNLLLYLSKESINQKRLIGMNIYSNIPNEKTDLGHFNDFKALFEKSLVYAILINEPKDFFNIIKDQEINGVVFQELESYKKHLIDNKIFHKDPLYRTIIVPNPIILQPYGFEYKSEDLEKMVVLKKIK